MGEGGVVSRFKLFTCLVGCHPGMTRAVSKLRHNRGAF